MGKESALASGPTVLIRPRLQTPSASLRRFLYDRFSPALRRWLDEGKMPETPKADAAAFRTRISFYCWEWMICFIRRIMRRKRRDHRLLRQYDR